ncbi:MAG: leucine-rich repeat protein, partial [Butyrivibrio sp.]|nr:leucine-rich repeat protein [Butyrivibrio sp.]
QYMEVDNAVYSKDGKTLYLVPSLAEGEDGVFNIAPGTKTIGTYAFSNCSRLTTVNIPDSVSDIQSYAFSGSSIRGTITIPQSVTSISNYAFAYARKVSYFILPSSLTNIGYNAFYYCEALKEINIPDSVVSMGSYAFGYCSSLKKANVSGSVGSIPGSCFYNCSKLDDVRLGEGITVMYGNAFGYCSSLVEILLPEGMKRLEGQTFNYCSSLEKVTIPASVDYIYNRTDWYKQGTTYYNVANAFYGTTEDMVIYGESGTTAEEFAECAIASWPKSSGAGCYVREGIYFSERSSDKFYITYMLDQLKGEYNHPDNPTSYRTLDNIIVLKDASKAGYTFDGWYTDRELTKKITEVVASFEARQLTLYPKFLENHTATIKAEGLPDRIETVPDTRSFKDQGITGTEIEGKQFVGFVNANDSSFDPEAPVYGDVTVTAVYTGDDSVAVKAPLASLKSGDIVVGSAISLKTETEDADIYYSFGDAALVNGSSIAADATKYGDRIIAEAELFEAGTLVLNAVAVKGDVISKKAVYEYRIADTTAFWGEVAPVDRAAFGSADEVPKGIWVAEVPERNPYTGSKITFDVRVYYGKLLLTEKTDYTLTYKNNVNVYTVKEGEDGFDPKKAPTITIKGKGNYKESRVVYFCINPVYLSSAMLQTKVTMYSNWDPELQKYAYPDAPDYDTSITLFDRVIASGKAQKLAPVVKADKVTLKAGKDYDVIYDDGNPDYKAPGCYYLTLKGKGNYAGEIMAGYVISEKTISPISKAKITGLQSKVPYSGQEITQKLKLTYTVNKKPVDLVSGTDYTISYENNISVGTASVIIRGRGSYAGQVIKTFKITGTPITKAKVKDLTASMSYDGKPKYQKNAYLEIPANKKNKTEAVVLKRGKDYTISYLNNVKAGTASVIFTGIGAYTGKIKKTFKITALETKTDQLRKHPNLIVKVSDAPYAKGGVKPPVSVTYKGLELTNGKDYTVSFKNNKKVYKLTEADEGFIAKQAPTATIKFKGSYKGSIVQYFCITEQSFELMSVTAQDLVFADKPGNFKNKVLIKDLDGKALKAGTDYDQNLVYTYAEKCGSKNAGAVIADTDTVPVGAVVKVTALAKASGSYTGSASAIYRIAQESIAKASIAVSKDAAFVYTGSGLVPRKTDITVKVGSTELAPSDYDIVSCTNNVKTGKGTITIKGKGPGYCGTKSATFQIAQKSLKMVAEVPETP